MAGRLKPLTLTKFDAGIHGDGGGLYLNVEPGITFLDSEDDGLRQTMRNRTRFPALTPLAEAREDAVKLRAKARKGEDILADKRAEQTPMPCEPDSVI